MKFDLETPCANCPFRSDVKPFIRPERAVELVGVPSFPCHKTVDYRNSSSGEVTEQSQMCAGYMILHENENSPTQMMRIAERLGVYDPENLDPDAQVYASFEDFIEAHRSAEQ